jgi:hypothetical protein
VFSRTETIQLSGPLKSDFCLKAQKGRSVKNSADVALMFGVKQPADNLLIHTKTGSKVRPRNPGIQHCVIQGRFRGK